MPYSMRSRCVAADRREDLSTRAHATTANVSLAFDLSRAGSFPSRMTIGMLLESMAGKAGACHGVAQDGTPFRFSEQHRAVDYFGSQLQAAGFGYHGTESMYSGVYGTEMQVQIFGGVVYYQRLRHMVIDKDQVRVSCAFCRETSTSIE